MIYKTTLNGVNSGLHLQTCRLGFEIHLMPFFIDLDYRTGFYQLIKRFFKQTALNRTKRRFMQTQICKHLRLFELYGYYTACYVRLICREYLSIYKSKRLGLGFDMYYFGK